MGYSESTFSKYAFGRGERVTKKSTLCTLVKMMTIMDDPLPKRRNMKNKKTTGSKRTLSKNDKSAKEKKMRVSRAKRPRKESSDDEEEEEWPCLICGEPFSNSRSREVWVQCQACHKWAHRECTSGNQHFFCPNCESDSDE